MLDIGFLTHSVWLLASVVFVGIAAAQLGQWCVDACAKNAKEAEIPASIAYFAGVAVLANVCIIASVALPAPWNFCIVLPLVFISGGSGVRRFGRTVLRHLGQSRSLPLRSQALLLVLFFVLGFHFLLSFHTPSDWDEVAYHVPVMKEIAAGQVRFPFLSSSPYNAFYAPFSAFYGNLAFGSEAFAAIPYFLSIYHPSAAHVAYFTHFCLFLLAITWYLRQKQGVSLDVVLVTHILLTTNYGILTILGTGLVDLNVMAYQCLAILLVILGIKEKSALPVLFSALFIGAAFGMKLTTAFLLPAYLLCVGVWMLRCPERSLRTILVSILLAFFGGGVWYLKNFVLFGNPFYPLYLGHGGINEEMYAFLIETLITSLRGPITLDRFVHMLSVSYRSEISTIFAVLCVIFGVVLGRLRKSVDFLLILFSCASFFLLNFSVGSQLSRYVLFVPVMFHLLAAQTLKRLYGIGLIVCVVVLAQSFRDPLLHSTWSAKSKAIVPVFVHHSPESAAQRIGCLAEVRQYCAAHCAPSDRVLNFWDPYAGVYYADEALFYTPPTIDDKTPLVLPKDVAFLYKNNTMRNLTLEHSVAHRDMKPTQRDALEQELIKSKLPVFESEECVLYELSP